MTRVKGFTLVELMVIVVLLAIIAAIAIPNFTMLIRNNQLQAKADELHDLLQYARGEAVTNRDTAELTINTGDWLLSVGDSERIIQSNATQAQVRTNLTGTSQIYHPNGTASAARFTICRDNDATSGYLIEVKASGITHLYPRGKQNSSGSNLTSCTP